MKQYYYFCGTDRKLRHGDGRDIKVGETLKVAVEPILCRQGLHASKRLIDALFYAPGPILCKVELGGTVIHGDDKSVAAERTTIAMADCTEVLREFARKCALDVTHLWDAPKVVVDYLKTGDEDIRAAAMAAARGSARGSAMAAAMAAARATIWDSARDSAWAAAWEYAWDSARAAARDSARGKQNRRLAAMIRKADWETT